MCFCRRTEGLALHMICLFCVEIQDAVGFRISCATDMNEYANYFDIRQL